MKATLLFLSGVGFQEILLIGLFVLVFFGAKKIPEFMKGLGKGVREFKDSGKDVKKEVEEASNAAKFEDGKRKKNVRYISYTARSAARYTTCQDLVRHHLDNIQKKSS
jgi:sec-independent protein translocase protein TatA